MAKKALVLAVDTYPPPASRLKSPRREAKQWASMLESVYGFKVKMPDEKQVTRSAVLGWLRDLLGGASKADHLCLVWCGHGTRSLGWASDTKHSTHDESAIVLYTPDGSNGFADYTITPSDIVRIIKDMKTPPDARFTSIIDSCFSAGFGGGGRRQFAQAINPVPLFIESIPGEHRSPEDLLEDIPTFLRLSDLLQREEHGQELVTPLVLAACPAKSPAFEVGPDEDRELLFSSTAFNALEVAKRNGVVLTSLQLIDDINNREKLQEASYHPADLAEERFLLAPTPRATASSSNQITSVASSNAQVLSNVTTPVGYLYIRVVGLATLFNGGNNPAAYPNRVILPYDNYADTEWKRHKSFIEVPDDSLKGDPSADPDDRYTRAGIIYSRWRLSEHLVRIENVDGAPQPVMRSADYIDHVPGLVAVADEQLTLSYECSLKFPRPGLFNAFLDLQNGTVDIGDLESGETTFVKKAAGDITWGPERTPISVLYSVPLSADHAAIVVNTIAGSQYAIYVKSGSTIILGNVREEDINGRGSGETPREHFKIYFNLVKVPPTDPGLPEVTSIPINACTVTNFP